MIDLVGKYLKQDLARLYDRRDQIGELESGLRAKVLAACAEWVECSRDLRVIGDLIEKKKASIVDGKWKKRTKKITMGK